MNNWGLIEAQIRSDHETDAARQILGWSAFFRAWLDARGTDARTVEPGDMAAFLDQEDWGPGSKNRQQRIWALRAVAKAARKVAPRRARSSKFATYWMDTVPDRSPLGKAVARVIAKAKSEGDRQRWTTALGVFARWCNSQGIAPEDAWLGDVDAFRRDYLASGKTSPGEYARVARMLIREISQESA